MSSVFRYSHWAGISDYTSPFGVAVTYVVIRQLELPCHCDLPALQAGTPYSKGTGLICRVPLTRLLRHAFAFSARGTCVSSRYGRPAPFSRAPGIYRIAPSHIRPFLTITVLHGLRCLDGATTPPGISRSVRAVTLQLDGTGILTCFPFAVLELRHSLGPTNPWPTNVAEETWPLRRLGFSPNYASTVARILIPTRSTGTYAPASAHAGRLPTPSPCGGLWSL